MDDRRENHVGGVGDWLLTGDITGHINLDLLKRRGGRVVGGCCDIDVTSRVRCWRINPVDARDQGGDTGEIEQ